MKLDYPTAAVIVVLLAIGWWVNVRRSGRLSVPAWRLALSVLGLALVTISFALFAGMRISLSEHPQAALELHSLFALVRQYTRFYPEYMAFGGALLGLFSKRYGRWTVFVSGTLAGLWWQQFMMSLV